MVKFPGRKSKNQPQKPQIDFLICFFNPIIGSIVVRCVLMFDVFVSENIGIPEVYLDPGRFDKVRESCRNNLQLISCNMDSVMTSYDQKTGQFHELLNSRVLQFERNTSIFIVYDFPTQVRSRRNN